jgi:hypothetical protein
MKHPGMKFGGGGGRFYQGEVHDARYIYTGRERTRAQASSVSF